MAHVTYGKLYDLPAMQPSRAVNRRPYTPPSPKELQRMREADAAMIGELRELAARLDRAGALRPAVPRRP